MALQPERDGWRPTITHGFPRRAGEARRLYSPGCAPCSRAPSTDSAPADIAHRRASVGAMCPARPEYHHWGADFENLDTHRHNLHFDNMYVVLTQACPEQPADLRGLA